MGSSYNNFLANIEVDEKEIKRELAKREIAKNKRQHFNPEQPKVRPNNNPVISNSRTQNNSTRSSLKTNSRSGLNNSPSNSVRGNRTSSGTSRNINGEVVNHKTSGRLSQENYYNLKQEQSRREEVNNKKNIKNIQNPNKAKVQSDNQKNYGQQRTAANKPQKTSNKKQVNFRVQDASPRYSTKRNSTQVLTKERLRNEHIHLRQKKMRNAKSSDTSKNSEQIQLTMSKKEYDQKVLGTIRENSTRFILFRDNTRLARVPKGVAFLGFYTFVLAAIMLLSFSQVAVVKMELGEVNNEYAKLNEINAQLNIKLATAYNIDNIRQRAENELYMSKPEPHQIMYISVVPENFVEYEIVDTEESKKNE